MGVSAGGIWYNFIIIKHCSIIGKALYKSFEIIALLMAR